MKRVLVVVFDFPPRRTSAVYRATNLLRYLLEYGWQPTVLTIEGRLGDLEDPSLLERFPPQINIERTRFLNIAGWEDSVAVGVRALGGLRSRHDQPRQPFRDRCVRSIGHLIRSSLYFPDDTVGWVPLGLARAIELHLEHRFNLIYSTSPPRSAPLIGLLMKALTGVPWVAEFRDPWYPPKGRWRRKAERLLLKRILNRATVVVVNASGQAAEFQDSYGVPAHKVKIVTNGFEEGDFSASDGRRSPLLPPGFIHMSQFGTIYPNFSGRFFDALGDLLHESPELKDRVRVNIIGFPDELTRRVATEGELKAVVRLLGFVPHSEAIGAMRSSDCLLIFLANRDVAEQTGLGKIYEYLRVGRPILAVTYPGGPQKLVEEGEAGWVVDPENKEDIKAALRIIVRNGERSDSPRPFRPKFVERFRYDHLAGTLAEVLNEAVGHGG